MNWVRILLFICLTPVLVVNAQSHLATDSSVIVIPHWKKGEIHKVSIKSSTSDFLQGKSKESLSTSSAEFTIVEKDTSGYTLAWEYREAALANNEMTIENHLLANTLHLTLLIKLSITGKFQELLNVDEVKPAIDKAVDRLLENNAANNALNMQFKAAKQMITTKQGLEIVLLKQIKFYFFSFGYKYKTNFVQTNNIIFPSPVGGKPFNATEKVELTQLNQLNNTCTIETNKQVNINELKNEIIEYLKKVSKKDTKSIETELAGNDLQFSEKSMQQIDFVTGKVLNSSFTRKMYLGFQNRTTLLEIKTVN